MGDDPARAALLGAWRLTEYGDRDAEGDPWLLTFGERPSGLIVYHPTGLLSAQVFADPHTPATVAYVGYVGRFRMGEHRADGDGFAGVVEHHMQAASDPMLLEEEPERVFRVAGDRLMLGDGFTARRIFERVG